MGFVSSQSHLILGLASAHLGTAVGTLDPETPVRRWKQMDRSKPWSDSQTKNRETDRKEMVNRIYSLGSDTVSSLQSSAA